MTYPPGPPQWSRLITEIGEPTKIVENKYYSEGRCDHPVPREIYRGHPQLQEGNGTSKPPMDPSEVEAEFMEVNR